MSVRKSTRGQEVKGMTPRATEGNTLKGKKSTDKSVPFTKNIKTKKAPRF